MSKFKWDDDKMELCSRCHFKDDNPDLCHGVEPPIVKPFLPKSTSDCVFIAESYWNRIPQEQKDEFLAELSSRSKRYWEKQDGAENHN